MGAATMKLQMKTVREKIQNFILDIFLDQETGIMIENCASYIISFK